jgi:hypothetical protein
LFVSPLSYTKGDLDISYITSRIAGMYPHSSLVLDHFCVVLFGREMMAQTDLEPGFFIIHYYGFFYCLRSPKLCCFVACPWIWQNKNMTNQKIILKWF